MIFIPSDKQTRRAFLRRSAQLAFTGAALPTALNLAAMGEAAAFNATDYKALVCVFLYGGNDYANTVVTYDNASYDLYSTIRGGGAGRTAGGIALGQSDLAATLLNPTTALPGGRQYALHPSMTGLAGLFNSGAAAVQLNVGPLMAPMTRQQYNTNSAAVPRPPKLFSHNDQQSIWQSSSPEGAKVGWGGHIGDLALGSNSNSLFTCMSVTGNTVFLSGDSALSYQLSTSGAVKIASTASQVFGSTAVQNTINQLMRQSRTHALEDEYNRVTKRALDSEQAISDALLLSPIPAAFPATLNNNSLATQLRMVARLIGARSSLGTKRQVFFVSMGGFDMHDGLLNGHVARLGQLSDAMTAFYNATVELGVADKVTTFTGSDFGRTLASNGDGSDHGWGSHHLMVGGAVNGRAFYGKAPPVSLGNSTTDSNDQWHVGQGRLLPSTSVDQYAATLASWFGVEGAEMAGVLPNLSRFGGVDYPTNLGFMA